MFRPAVADVCVTGQNSGALSSPHSIRSLWLQCALAPRGPQVYRELYKCTPFRRSINSCNANLCELKACSGDWHTCSLSAAAQLQWRLAHLRGRRRSNSAMPARQSRGNRHPGRPCTHSNFPILKHHASRPPVPMTSKPLNSLLSLAISSWTAATRQPTTRRVSACASLSRSASLRTSPLPHLITSQRASSSSIFLTATSRTPTRCSLGTA